MNNSMFNRIDKYLTALSNSNLINYIFLGYLLLFLADNIINQFVHMPVFVVGGMVLLAGFLPYLWAGGIRKHAWVYIGLVVLVLLMVFNSFKDGFHVKNISDLFFLVLFVFSYMAYTAARHRLKTGYVWVFITASLLLFAAPQLHSLLAGMRNHDNVASHAEHMMTNAGKRQSSITTLNKQHAYHSISNNTLSLKQTAGFLQFGGKDDSPETRRRLRRTGSTVKGGYYRIPHVASYFFGFSAFFLAFLALSRKQFMWLLIIPSLVLLYLSMYTGARSFFFALLLAVCFFLVQRRYWFLVLAAIVLATLILYFRYDILKMLDGTFFQKHFAMVILLTDYFSENTRAVLAVRWYQEVSGFQWYEWFTGRSYISGLFVTRSGALIWFHNDFLSMAYSYGLLGLSYYVAFFVKIFIDVRKEIRGNFFISLFYITSLWTAVFNGYYYYFTVFLLYMFFLMVREENKKLWHVQYDKTALSHHDPIP